MRSTSSLEGKNALLMEEFFPSRADHHGEWRQNQTGRVASFESGSVYLQLLCHVLISFHQHRLVCEIIFVYLSHCKLTDI